MTKTLLLTGAGGLVGRNILQNPAIMQWTMLTPSRDDLDLTDWAMTRDYVRRYRPDIIIHGAGRVGGIQANIAHPVAFLVDNLNIGKNIIMAAREAGVPRLLNLASSCMYPRNATNPLTEDFILKGELEPTNEGYALAKIFATRLCEYIMREQQEMHYKTLVPCNLYGCYDKFDPRHSHLIPAIIHKIHEARVAGRDEVDIWGDGTARREFMYAGDAADAVLRAAAEIESIPPLMNIGLGHDYSINEYYTAAAEVIGWEGRFVHDLSKPAGMKQKLVSIERQTAWGWSPATSLHDGIERTYRHYLEDNQP
ncbi:GDP-L-fucose synthase family protein [Sphingosinicella soli]|uniref:GDP-L-fucose synthase n=1 Tax=Sphingosinicella soli TaxID=333708 RepID=A0A7W7B0T7_9SPHN|nr:GDP-L-fucose synthase [Sphingosinicella soli]MBB4631769.1 GDP-L-fucose synthase [Sphingosinicella soli]